MKGWAAALAAVMLAGCRSDAGEAKAKPELYVLTSLPLLFDEGFGLAPAKGEAATYLRERYTLKPIDLPSQLPKGAVLLAAQPRALPAEELVMLDAWVRDGGRLLLLADPMLRWPSSRPLGDRLRPPIQYPDTGLLGHWGLRLDTPDPKFFDETRRRGPIELGNFTVEDSDPGKFVLLEGPGCRLRADAAIADCPLGKGHATIIADADFLNVGDGEIRPGLGDNLPFLSSELKRLAESR